MTTSSIRNVTIIGAGNVGSALARNFVRHGLRVALATPELAKTRTAAAAIAPDVRAVELAAIDTSDAVFLAVPAEAAAPALAAATGLPDRTLIVDCTNPLRWDNGPIHAPPAEGSTTAQLAAKFARFRVVKSFNTFGAEFHDQPALAAGPADLYIAGDDADGKQQLAELGRLLGYAPVDAGPLRNAAVLEQLAMLWIHLATVGGHGRQVAFKLLPR